jgi:hypothetical protein
MMADGDQVDPREHEIARLIGEGLNMTEIAAARGVKRQAIWEFCARRGWLGDESLAKIEAKDERRRKSRRVRPDPARQRRAG